MLSPGDVFKASDAAAVAVAVFTVRPVWDSSPHKRRVHILHQRAVWIVRQLGEEFQTGDSFRRVVR